MPAAELWLGGGAGFAVIPWTGSPSNAGPATFTSMEFPDPTGWYGAAPLLEGSVLVSGAKTWRASTSMGGMMPKVEGRVVLFDHERCAGLNCEGRFARQLGRPASDGAVLFTMVRSETTLPTLEIVHDNGVVSSVLLTPGVSDPHSDLVIDADLDRGDTRVELAVLLRGSDGSQVVLRYDVTDPNGSHIRSREQVVPLDIEHISYVHGANADAGGVRLVGFSSRPGVTPDRDL